MDFQKMITNHSQISKYLEDIVPHLNRDSHFNIFRKTKYLNMKHWSMTLIEATTTIFEHLSTMKKLRNYEEVKKQEEALKEYGKRHPG